MEKLKFTSENVINCVHNEPALWDAECTGVHSEILHVSTHIIGLQFWKQSAVRVMSVSVSDILFNQYAVFPFILGC